MLVLIAQPVTLEPGSKLRSGRSAGCFADVHGARGSMHCVDGVADSVCVSSGRCNGSRFVWRTALRDGRAMGIMADGEGPGGSETGADLGLSYWSG